MYRSDLWLATVKLLTFMSFPMALALVIFVVVWGASKISGKSLTHGAEIFGASFGFGAIAAVLGIIMATSRTPAVGNVIPAALTLISGLALYLISKERGQYPVIISAIISFSAMMFFGTVVGFYERNRAVEELRIRQFNPEILAWQADVEFAVNAYRKTRNLPPLSLTTSRKENE